MFAYKLRCKMIKSHSYNINIQHFPPQSIVVPVIEKIASTEYWKKVICIHPVSNKYQHH